ncbi:MAG: hypothetical protein JXD22_11225 [Sedimentisphaerales bacterium]|nr:hypothetical protein [Sedimentisphaerales bacterium]
MARKVMVMLVAGVMIMVVSVGLVQARSPVALADSAISSTVDLVDKFVVNTQADALDSIAKIDEYLASGDVARAEKTADSTITTIRRVRQRYINRINRICNSAYLNLIKMGQSELALDVEYARQAALIELMDVGDYAIDQIYAALDGGMNE